MRASFWYTIQRGREERERERERERAHTSGLRLSLLFFQIKHDVKGAAKCFAEMKGLLNSLGRGLDTDTQVLLEMNRIRLSLVQEDYAAGKRPSQACWAFLLSLPLCLLLLLSFLERKEEECIFLVV